MKVPAVRLMQTESSLAPIAFVFKTSETPQRDDENKFDDNKNWPDGNMVPRIRQLPMVIHRDMIRRG